MVGIVVNNVFLCEKQRNIRKKYAKICKNGDFRYFRPEKPFSKFGLGYILSIANTNLSATNQKKLIINSRENAQKPFFPAFLAGKKISFLIGLRSEGGWSSS